MGPMDDSSSAPGLRERNKEQNRERILDAARRCFVERGYDAVTVRDIIRLTGLATGTFYNYYPDKEAVFAALVEDYVRGITRELHEIRSSATDLRTFVHDTYLTVFSRFCAEPELFHLISRNEHYIRELYLDSVLGISISYLKDDIRSAIDRGLIDDTDVDCLAAAFYGVGFEMTRVLVQREDRDPAAAAELASRIFLRGVGP